MAKCCAKFGERSKTQGEKSLIRGARYPREKVQIQRKTH